MPPSNFRCFSTEAGATPSLAQLLLISTCTSLTINDSSIALRCSMSAFFERPWLFDNLGDSILRKINVLFAIDGEWSGGLSHFIGSS